MTFAHEAVAALPVGGPADAALIRALCTRRFAYALAASETPGSFVAVDPASGVVPLYVIQNNIMFQYDSTDSTTVNDGVTCLVSSDAKRFKAATITPPYSVLTRATVAQPVSPTVGDTYLIPTAATGTDWSGKDGQIGIYTAAGWRFAVSPIGRFLYVKDETAFYYRAASGAWTAGVGSIVLGAGSVNLTNILGAKASFTIKVENQTTNAPPGSPATPTAYIIGPSPTGAWAGNAGKLAICLVAGAFTIITPDAGDTVYDKALNNAYRFNGTAWVSSAGSFINSGLVFTASAAATTGDGGVSGSTAYDPITAPVRTNIAFSDPQALAYAARASGARLRFIYRAEMAATGGPTNLACGIYKDTDSAMLDWQELCIPTGNATLSFPLIFETTASGTSSHNYKIIFFRNAGGFDISSVSRRRFTVEEFSL